MKKISKKFIYTKTGDVSKSPTREDMNLYYKIKESCNILPRKTGEKLSQMGRDSLVKSLSTFRSSFFNCKQSKGFEPEPSRKKSFYTIETQRYIIKDNKCVLKDYSWICTGTIKEGKEEIRKLISQDRKGAKENIKYKEEKTFSSGGLSKSYTLIARSHDKPGFVLELLRFKEARKVYDPKKPKDNFPYVGIELEFFTKDNEETLAKRLHEAGLSSYVCLKDDGSISPDRGMISHELAILVRENEYKDIIPKVTSVLCSAGAKVNRTCGMHVHIDMRNRDKSRVFSNLVSAQRYLYLMNPESRKKGSYCKETTSKDFDKITDRYSGINPKAYTKHRTIEVRIHSGTVDSEKIINWVDIILIIVNREEEVKRVASTLSGFVKQYKIPSNLAEYIAKRMSLFNTQEQVEESV